MPNTSSFGFSYDSDAAGDAFYWATIKQEDEQLNGFRAEAEDLLGMKPTAVTKTKEEKKPTKSSKSRPTK